MKSSALNISDNVQFRLFLASAFVLLIYKLFISGSLIHMLISDLLILITVAFLFISLIVFFNKRKASPFSLIMNIGILNAFVFFLITFSDSFMSLLFENVNERIDNPSIISVLVMLVYLLLIVGFITYVMVTLRHLFFLRQSNTQQVYFITMLVFFILASFAGFAQQGFNPYQPDRDTRIRRSLKDKCPSPAIIAAQRPIKASRMLGTGFNTSI